MVAGIPELSGALHHPCRTESHGKRNGLVDWAPGATDSSHRQTWL